MKAFFFWSLSPCYGIEPCARLVRIIHHVGLGHRARPVGVEVGEIVREFRQPIDVVIVHRSLGAIRFQMAVVVEYLAMWEREKAEPKAEAEAKGKRRRESKGEGKGDLS